MDNILNIRIKQNFKIRVFIYYNMCVFVMCIASTASSPRQLMSNALVRRERQNFAPIAREWRMPCQCYLLCHCVYHCVALFSCDFYLLADWRADWYKCIMATLMCVVIHPKLKLWAFSWIFFSPIPTQREHVCWLHISVFAYFVIYASADAYNNVACIE